MRIFLVSGEYAPTITGIYSLNQESIMKLVSMLRLLLIDDHAIVREGFKRLFDAEADMQVIGEAGNAGV